MGKMKNLYIILAMVIAPAALLAFEGKVFSVSGNQVTITGEGVAHLKAGQKFAVFNGTAKTGEIVVLQASHTQAKAKLLNGVAAKDSAVREVVAENVGAGSKPIQDGSFRDNGDGTVTDTKTGLIWQKCSMGQNNDATCSGEASIMTWKEAKTECANLELAMKKWHLPEKEELKSLIYCSDGTKTEDINEGHPKECGWSGGDKYEKKYKSPTIHQKYFPGTDLGAYWSSSTNFLFAPYAWTIYFSSGFMLNFGDVGYKGKPDFHYVRCVSGP